jgi:hypothetical protein
MIAIIKKFQNRLRKMNKTQPPVEKKEKLESIQINLAGAEATIHDGSFEVRFHSIPPALWNAIIGFHRQVSINMDAESVSYHHWHKGDKEYHTIIPFQTSTGGGLHLNVDWEHADNVALLDKYAEVHKEAFFPACTIHTHVDTVAFESGTDARDEEEAPGWHITLGHLVSFKNYDLDFRMRLPQSKRVAARVNTKSKFPLTSKHIFSGEVTDVKFISTTPGSTDFHHLLNRVTT